MEASSSGRMTVPVESAVGRRPSRFAVASTTSFASSGMSKMSPIRAVPPLRGCSGAMRKTSLCNATNLHFPPIDRERRRGQNLNFLRDRNRDPNGWTEVSDVYRAPQRATQTVVELGFRWASGGTVEWSDVSLRRIHPPTPRTVRLATVHFQPKAGRSNLEKCRQFAPLIAEAADQQADLVVLPETLTAYASGRSYAECAEPIPGPSTDYFGQLAKQHDLYIVAGLHERVDNLVYNVAVLIGPEGRVTGTYRKVCLPRSEIEGGTTPGFDYPVFDTRFGRVGMMVCYDGFFPEVARELTCRGAEVIAWPVWGCNPLLARAAPAKTTSIWSAVPIVTFP